MVIDITYMHAVDIEDIKKIAQKSNASFVEQKVYGVKSIVTVTIDEKK